AGNEQHAQILADAVDQRDGAVVGVGQFARHGVDGELDDVAAGGRDRHLQRHRLADGGVLDRHLLAIDRDADIDRAGLIIGGDDAVAYVERLTDQAEARRVLEAYAAV